MGAVSSEFDRINPTDSFLGVLDEFAALRSYSNAPAVGGYRVLTAKGHAKRSTAARAPRAAAALARIAHARIRLTGSLSVLFIGGLGLAVLAGPANCPCSLDANLAQRSSLTRLGYVENADFVRTREEMAREAKLPALAVAAVVEPAESAVGVSPITTSALVPSQEVPAMKREALGTVSAAMLPPIEPLADLGPTVRLAAASNIESDVPPELPVITVQTPPDRILANSSDDEKPRVKRKRALRAYRTPIAKSERQGTRPGDEQLVKRAPKWAQQMYVTPWQMQAFSYTR